MKRAALIVFVLAAQFCAHAQLPQRMQFTLASNGDLTLSWPIEVIRLSSPKLTASYQVEVADSFTNWQANGSILRGENFPLGRASVRFSSLRDEPASFFRVRTLLDFSGRDFGGVRIINLKLNG